MPKLAKRDLTDAALKAAKAPRTGTVEMTDRAVRGLAFRVSASGVRSWILTHTRDGRRTRTVLGHYPGMTLQAARIAAGAAKDDPTVLVKKSEPEAPGIMTFGEIAHEYIKRQCRATRSDGSPLLKRGWEIERIVGREVVPHLGAIRAPDLRKRHLRALTTELAESKGPAAANKVHETAMRVMNWATSEFDEDEIGIEVNPFVGLTPPVKKVQGDRVLTDDEIKSVWAACDGMGYPFGPLYRLLFLTATRLNEAAQAQWGEFDLDARTWTIPGERSKNGKPHVLPLSDQALVLVKSLPRWTGGEYLFSTTGGRRPVSGFSKAKARLNDLSGTGGWKQHDIRRTCA
jgi:integrase